MKSFYNSSFFRSLAEGLINPFLSLFALSLGATKTMIGLVSSLPDIAGLFSQIFWGTVTEVSKKKTLVILGGIFWAILWIPISQVTNPTSLLILLIIQSVLSSISVPAWTCLLIQNSPSYKRGTITGYLNAFSGIGSLIGNLAGGLILNKFGFTPFLFYMIFFFGLMSRLAFLPVKETKTHGSFKVKDLLAKTFNFKQLKRDRKLMKFIRAMIFMNFAVSIAGPFFSIYTIQKLGGTKMDVALVSAIGVISSIIFYRTWGTIIDYLGKKKVMLSCIIPICFIPFSYAISKNMILVYIYTIIGQMSWAGFNTASFAYLSDIIPKENISSNVATYNLFTGLSQSVAPFIGGIVADMTSIWFVFMLSTVLRVFSMMFFENLEKSDGASHVSILHLAPEPFGIMYRFETFISTYSLALDGVRKENVKLVDYKMYLKKIRKILRQE
jgi:MFS family permease